MASLETLQHWLINKPSGVIGLAAVLPLLPMSVKTIPDDLHRLLDRKIEESVLIHRSKFDILLSRKEEWHRVQATRVLSQAQVALSLDGHVQVGGGGRGEHHQVRGGREMRRQNKTRGELNFVLAITRKIWSLESI